MGAVTVRHVTDLGRQFPRWSDHKGSRPAQPLATCKSLQRWEQKRRRLAGAGLGARDEITALKNDGNGLCLDGRRCHVAGNGNRADNSRVYTERWKRHC
tara:strand:+ start:1474 stop:1770 length:297 start_codon:yes stop_codon:yes gene_type:complete